MAEEAVLFLIGPAGGAAPAPMAEDVQKAGRLDPRTAKRYCQVLLEHLAQAPGSPRELEALVVLGLAHPRALVRAHVPIAQQGRRVAQHLEREGRIERAQELLELLSSAAPADRSLDHELASMMRRSGNADRLAERYLARSEAALRDGHRQEAIRWLREILLVDGSRRDVARMIRDLRYAEVERRARWRARARTLALALLLCGLASAAVWREIEIRRKYAALPPAAMEDARSMRQRVASLSALIETNPLWLGMLDASRERAALRAEIERVESRAAERERLALEERSRLEVTAEASRLRGRILCEQGDWAGALREFLLALEVAPEGWEHASQVEADLIAIERWQRERGDPRQEARR